MGTMTRSWPTTILATTLVGLQLTSDPTAQTSELWAGTWKLNVELSKYGLSLAPQSGTSTLERIDDEWKLIADGVDAQGNPTHLETVVRFDGKDYPVIPANGRVTWAFTRVDDRAYEQVTKVDGNVTTTTRTLVSPDGSTRTSITVGKNADGRQVSNVAIYERVTKQGAYRLTR
jgi:hypothetical protein